MQASAVWPSRWGRCAALVGRTLDLSLLVRLDAGEDPASLCTEAELAYSDTRIDARKLTVRTTATGEAGQALIRVTSSAIVDELVVSLTLRAGCKSRSMRRYILLAELPLESSHKALAPSAPPVAAAGNALGSESPSGLFHRLGVRRARAPLAQARGKRWLKRRLPCARSGSLAALRPQPPHRVIGSPAAVTAPPPGRGARLWRSHFAWASRPGASRARRASTRQRRVFC